MSVPVTQITAAGPVVPAFTDVLTAIQAAFQNIYGSDVYIAEDSQDGQLLAIFAQAISDLNQQLANVYFQFAPQTAIGVGLDQVVKVNGIRRKSSTFSTVPLIITGEANTIIPAGIVGDSLGLGTSWTLPINTTIPGSGTITVTGTCTTPGATIVPEGSLTVITGGATSGWQSVTNAVLPSAGAAIETDMALRQRQSISVALAALTPLATIIAAVSNIENVTRYAIYENDTDSWSTQGIPPHSIAVVAGGGATSDVCNAIASTKNPGTGTYGTTSQIVIDPAGVPNTINYMQLEEVECTITISIRALPTYAATTAGFIQQAVSAWVSQLPIGSVVYQDKLKGVADLQGTIAQQATGKTQPALDQLSATYVIYGITMTRTPNFPAAYVTGGPYSAGATAITITNTADMYPDQALSITLDNGTSLATNITTAAIVAGTINISPGVPASRQILTNAPVYMTADIACAFYEAPEAATTDVTVTVT